MFNLFFFFFRIILRYKKKSEQKRLDDAIEMEQQQSSSNETTEPVVTTMKKTSLHKINSAKVMIIPTKALPLKKHSSTLPTIINGENMTYNVNRGQYDLLSPAAFTTCSSLNVNNETSKIENSGQENVARMTADTNSVVLAPNCAYNKVLPPSENQPGGRSANKVQRFTLNSRQRSVEHSYDYPQLRAAAGRHFRGVKRKSEGHSSAYDSITTVTNTSYSVGNKRL